MCYVVFRTVVLSLPLLTERETETQRMQKWLGSEASGSGVAGQDWDRHLVCSSLSLNAFSKTKGLNHEPQAISWDCTCD